MDDPLDSLLVQVSMSSLDTTPHKEPSALIPRAESSIRAFEEKLNAMNMTPFEELFSFLEANRNYEDELDRVQAKFDALRFTFIGLETKKLFLRELCDECSTRSVRSRLHGPLANIENKSREAKELDKSEKTQTKEMEKKLRSLSETIARGVEELEHERANLLSSVQEFVTEIQSLPSYEYSKEQRRSFAAYDSMSDQRSQILLDVIAAKEKELEAARKANADLVVDISNLEDVLASKEEMTTTILGPLLAQERELQCLEDTQQVISLLSGIQFVPHESTMKLRAIVDIPSPLSQDSSSASIAARITLILTKSSPSVDMGWTLVAHEVDSIDVLSDRIDPEFEFDIRREIEANLRGMKTQSDVLASLARSRTRLYQLLLTRFPA